MQAGIVVLFVALEWENPYYPPTPRPDLAVIAGVMFAFVFTCFAVMAAEATQWLRFHIALRRRASPTHVSEPEGEGRRAIAARRFFRKLPK